MEKRRSHLILFLVLVYCLSPVYGCKRILKDQEKEIPSKRFKLNLISEKIKQIKANVLIQRDDCNRDLDPTKEKTKQINNVNLSLNMKILILKYLSQDTLISLRTSSKSIYLAIRNIEKERILSLSNQFLISPFFYKNITSLFLPDNQIDDKNIQYIPFLTSLTSLDISGGTNFISDIGIQALSRIKGLSHLNLSAAIISEDSIRYLFPLSNLTHLNLSLNNITDFSVQYLSSLTCLECLNLNDNKITNVGLQYLFPLENLTNLYLEGNQVTDTDDESEPSDSFDVL